MRFGRAAMVSAARRRGWFVGRYPPDALAPFHLRHVLSRLPVVTAVDVGAHRGEWARELRAEVGFTGRIVSFEPAPEAFAALARSGVAQAHQLALGAADGTASLTVYDQTQGSSLHELRADSWAADAFGASHKVDVQVRRLDAIADDLIGPGPWLLKVDAQGHDLAVLDGAAGVLERVAALQIEASVAPIYDGAPALPETLMRVHDLGFTLTGIFAVNREPPDWVRLVDVDCFFVRR